MDERQLDALVASSPENVSYLADIPRLPSVMDAVDVHVVVFRDLRRNPAIIMPAVSLDHYAQSRSEIRDVRIYNPFYYLKTKGLDYASLSEAERKLSQCLSLWSQLPGASPPTVAVPSIFKAISPLRLPSVICIAIY